MAKLNSEKRRPKQEVKLNIQLNEEQKAVVTSYYSNDIIYINGDYGTGKTALSVYIALKSFFAREIDKIVITKPILKSRINILGSVPGDLEEKMDVHVAHIKQCMYDISGREKIDKMIEEGDIQIVDINLIKGYTFGSTENTLIIVDEYQDMFYEDKRTILTRTGANCKIIFTGSVEQIDRSINGKSCIHRVVDAKHFQVDGVAFHTLLENHRNEKMYRLIQVLDSLGNEK